MILIDKENSDFAYNSWGASELVGTKLQIIFNQILFLFLIFSFSRYFSLGAPLLFAYFNLPPYQINLLLIFKLHP